MPTDQEKKWLKAWAIAAEQLPLIKQSELCELSEEQGTRLATWLGILDCLPPVRTSGLIEWQKLMKKLQAKTLELN